MDWNSYFATLKDWKRLPAYKAEPRVDSLVGHYLLRLLPDLLGIDVCTVIPELPLRKGTLRAEFEGTVHAERSWKVDFLAVGPDRNWLIEMKTDSGSRRDVQDDYLRDAVRAGTGAVVNGIVRIARISPYKRKYAHLLETLRQAGLLQGESWTGRNPLMEILYVQPRVSVDGERGIGFVQIADWLEGLPDAGEFERAFAGALREWEGD